MGIFFPLPGDEVEQEDLLLVDIPVLLNFCVYTGINTDGFAQIYNDYC